MSNILFKSYKIWLFSFSIIGSLYVLYFNNKFDYQNLYLLPLSYFIINYFFIGSLKKTDNRFYNPGLVFHIALLVIFIRYVITPVSMIYTNFFSGIGIEPSKSSIDTAILLMIVELIFIYLTFFLTIRFYKQKRLNNTNTINLLPLNPPLFIFILITISIIVSLDPSLLIPKNLIKLEFENHDGSEIRGGFIALSNLIKHVGFVLILSLIIRKKKHTNNKIYTILGFIISAFYISLIIGISRWDILFSGALSFYMLNLMYGKLPKVVVILMILMVVITIMSITIYKYSWYLRNSQQPIQDSLIFMLEGFQAYFSGARNVAQSIEMTESSLYQNSINTFLNDFLGSIPILSNYIDQSNRINVHFCQYIGLRNNTSQIIPMIGIGYAYLKIFPFIFTIICEWAVIKLDFLLQKSTFLEMKFIYLYMSFYMVLCMGFNTQIIFAFFITVFIPLVILFKMNRKIII